MIAQKGYADIFQRRLISKMLDEIFEFAVENVDITEIIDHKDFWSVEVIIIMMEIIKNIGTSAFTFDQIVHLLKLENATDFLFDLWLRESESDSFCHKEMQIIIDDFFDDTMSPTQS